MLLSREITVTCEKSWETCFSGCFPCPDGEEAGHFDFAAIVDGLFEKLIRRHPHVFPDGTLASATRDKSALNPDQVKQRWQEIKSEEKKRASENQQLDSALPDKLPATLPALKKAEKIQQAAARVGFDWEEANQVINKINEELTEVSEASQKESQERVAEEVGDLLFACVNYSRHLGVDPEMALRKATRKFDQRFRVMESLMNEKRAEFDQLSLNEMEDYWQQAKRRL